MFTELQKVYSLIFDQGAEHRLSVEEERETIRKIRSGDSEAFVALMFSLAPLLRNSLKAYEEHFGSEDAKSRIVEALLIAVKKFDPKRSVRIAGIAKTEIRQKLGWETDYVIPVHYHARRRYAAIMVKADGDLEFAEQIAPEFGMTAQTFRATHAALNQTIGYDPEVDGQPIVVDEEHAPETDRVLVQRALSAVSGDELTVTRYAYGFETGEPLTDGGIVEIWSIAQLGEEAVRGGQSWTSRARVQRLRTSAVSRMREALDVDLGGE